MRGVTGFNGARLIQARSVRGLTQASLSAITGYSRPSISKWESGDQLPEAIAVSQIAKALGVSDHWLMREPIISNDNQFFFRSNTTATKQVRLVSTIRLEWAFEISNILQEWVGLPDVNLPKSISREAALALTDAEIETLSEECRSHWGLKDGPISNIMRLIESAGIVVIREESGYVNMDGVSSWFEQESRPYIWLAADKASFVRSRFDLAHELGHIIMHRHLESEDHNNPSKYKEIERQAHLFAAAFIMPASSIALELRNPTLDSLVLSKRRWGASVGALIMRASTLNLISDEHKSRLFRNYSYRGWKTREPYDAETPVESPTLLSKSIKLLLDQGGFRKHDLVEKTGFSAKEIENICGLPSDFMSDNFGELIPFKPKLKFLV